MTRRLCPICAEEVVSPRGSKNADILIVGEFPGRDEIKQGKVFVGGTGYVLRTELAHVGIDLVQCRLTNLWMHKPNKDERCFDVGYKQVIQEAKGKRAILLVGSDTVKTFTGMKVSDVCGLEIDVPVFSADVVFAMVNPAIVYHGGIGEVRLALEKFSKRLEELEII